jgi:glutamyl-tRNA synthetase
MVSPRVRFAPSPTGPLHIGGLRTALYNYLFAKKNGGSFILRIEDTDRNRYVNGTEEYILESLKWCGLEIDESTIYPGNFGPYRQSERKDIYIGYANQLIEKGWAYYAFDTPEELEEMRIKAENDKQTFTYGLKNRMKLKNSLSLNTNETEEFLATIPYVIRFKIPENQQVIFKDLIRGEIAVDSSTLDDKILFKSDGMPTYHLANIVDDHLMEISHVIRGEEWLPSAPLHVLLYRAFEWDAPEFAHLPVILKPQGKGKLSKRDGDKMGFPVFPLNWTDPNSGEVFTGYRESGYFADAFINMLALLGWNPGTEQELFSLEELVQAFSLERVGKSGAKFDPEKAKWFNQNYLRNKSSEELYELFKVHLKKHGLNGFPADKCIQIIELVKDRSVFIADMWEQSYFFFFTPKKYDEKTVSKRWKADIPIQIEQLTAAFRKVEKWNAAILRTVFTDFIETKELGFGKLANALRLAIVGAGTGPDLFKIMELIGKEESLKRMELALKKLPKSHTSEPPNDK